MDNKVKHKLKRNIKLPMLIFYGLGNIFGAGIYVLIGEMAGLAGIYIPLSFLLACIIVSFTALSYAELSARYPDFDFATLNGDIVKSNGIVEGGSAPGLDETLFGT